MAKLLLLVSRDHGSGKSTIAIPAARLRPRITARHPPQELSMVDDEVGEGELMRVEEERRDTESEDGTPEVDEMRNPKSHGDVE